MAERLPLCALCIRQIAGEGGVELVEEVNETFHCVVCFGILDPVFIKEVAKSAEEVLEKNPCDASSFVLALNLPVSQTLRESVIKKRFPAFNGILSTVPFKIRNINAFLAQLQEASGLKPSLLSDLHLTITLENDEFLSSDSEFMQKIFPQELGCGRKRRHGDQRNDSDLTKVKLMNVAGRLKEEHVRKFPLDGGPSRKCTYSFSFERDPYFVAGRYCKYSRSLPQSPWTAEEETEKEPGHSVSEKICAELGALLGAEQTRFVASGREDIDVRMLGDGRPFVIHLINCKKVLPLKSAQFLEELRSKINLSKDISISPFVVLNRVQAELLSQGHEDKAKLYTAYCYSTLPFRSDLLKSLPSKCPLVIQQLTPVRVMKRRALLDRPRTIHTLEALPLDQFHFLLRISTQAGTYVKEFIHGDFGRTTPSLADLIGCENGEVDIIELDVEAVDMIWPPLNGPG